MKTPSRWIALLGLALGALVFLYCVRFPQRGADRSVAPPVLHDSSGTSKSLLGTRFAIPPEASGPIINIDMFGLRFDLKQVAVLRMRDRVRDRMDKWREQKGSGARVLSVEGKILRMFIPALPLSPDQLRREVEVVVAAEVGFERARAICQSQQGLETLVHWAALDLLLMDQDCTFTRIKDEGRVDQHEFAVFSVELDQHAVFDGIMPRYEHEMQFLGGDYNGLAGSNLLSWAALAKAPVGYFRSEPIFGPDPAAKPLVVVYEDWDTGDVTIHNLRGKGSVEHSNLNDR